MTEQLFDAPPRYTYTQAAVAAGMDPDRAVQLWQSMGLTTPAHSDELFPEVDVQALRLAGLLTEQWLAFGADLATARAWAQAMARLSEWQVDMLRHLAETVHELRSVAMQGFERVQPWPLRSAHHKSVNRPIEQQQHPEPD